MLLVDRVWLSLLVLDESCMMHSLIPPELLKKKHFIRAGKNILESHYNIDISYVIGCSKYLQLTQKLA